MSTTEVAPPFGACEAAEALAAWAERVPAMCAANGVADIFLERRVERCWRVHRGSMTGVETASTEGGACRWAGGRLASADGLERAGLAALAGLDARRLPSIPLPTFAPAPCWEDLGVAEVEGLVTVRWLWRVAVVASPSGLARVSRPVLLDLAWADGRRTVRPWPLRPGWSMPAPAPLRPAHPPSGPVRALLAPQAAATLLHELLGHPLEGDLLLGGTSIWHGRMGERVLSLPLELWDDPTRWDLPGAFDSDDEGARAAPCRLVHDGVLVGTLADASRVGPLGAAAGNARRATHHSPPRPRVSNLVSQCAGALAEPPRQEADVEVEAVSAGTLEPRSGLLMLQVRAARALRHGRPTRALGAFTLVGRAHEVANGLLAACGVPTPSAEPGWCGKDGEVVPTGSEAPWLLVAAMEAR